MIVLKLTSGHDVNGNPRRLFMPLRDIEIGSPDIGVLAVIDIGYSGSAGLVELFPGEQYNVIEIVVPVKEYREWIAYGKEKGIYSQY